MDIQQPLNGQLCEWISSSLSTVSCAEWKVRPGRGSCLSVRPSLELCVCSISLGSKCCNAVALWASVITIGTPQLRSTQWHLHTCCAHCNICAVDVVRCETASTEMYEDVATLVQGAVLSRKAVAAAAGLGPDTACPSSPGQPSAYRCTRRRQSVCIPWTCPSLW